MKAPIAPEGRSPVVFLLIALLLSILFQNWYVCILFALFTIAVALFFRDPDRESTAEDNIILSPADGTVITIDESVPPFGGPKQKHVAIFMSVANVHVNRMPVDGKIEQIKHESGKFIVASRQESCDLNERNSIKISSKFGEITVVQIAGLVARRIVCYLREGQEVPRNQRLGIIKFGSRVDTYLPGNCKILVKLGDKTKAGETLLGRMD